MPIPAKFADHYPIRIAEPDLEIYESDDVQQKFLVFQTDKEESEGEARE